MNLDYYTTVRKESVEQCFSLSEFRQAKLFELSGARAVGFRRTRRFHVEKKRGFSCGDS